MFALTRQDTAVLKGIAICAMLCHHLYGYPPVGVEPYSGLLAWLGVLGKVCVALFLFCSGYGLAANYKPQTILDDIRFVAKRLVKFYANYWVIFLIFVPITIFAFHRSLTDAYGDNANIYWCLFKDILGLQGYESYNVTWWFNRLIIILYLLFPIIYRIVRIQPIIALVLGMIVLRFGSHLSLGSVEIYMWQFPFVVGVAWQICENKFSKVTTWFIEHRYIFAISSICLMILFIVLRMWPIIPHWTGVRMDGFLSGAIALFVVSIMRYATHLSQILSYLGKHSMNMYMTHTFVNAFWCSQLLHTCEWMRGGGNFVVLVAICLLISIAVEFLKEKIRFFECVNYIIKRI